MAALLANASIHDIATARTCSLELIAAVEHDMIVPAPAGDMPSCMHELQKHSIYKLHKDPARVWGLHGSIADAVFRLHMQDVHAVPLVVVPCTNASTPGSTWLLHEQPKAEGPDVESLDTMSEADMFYNCSTAPWRFAKHIVTSRLPLTLNNVLVDTVDVVRLHASLPVLPRERWCKVQAMLIPVPTSPDHITRLMEQTCIVAERLRCSHIVVSTQSLLDRSPSKTRQTAFVKAIATAAANHRVVIAGSSRTIMAVQTELAVTSRPMLASSSSALRHPITVQFPASAHNHTRQKQQQQ